MEWFTGWLLENHEGWHRVLIHNDRWKLYIEGLGNTVALAALACIIGLVIGTIIAMLKYYTKGKKNVVAWLINSICYIYITVLRGTPLLLQLLIAYNVFFDGGFEAALFAFGINSGAYMSEIIRAGIDSVDRGQMEAGRSLGLSEGATMILIVVPQAVKNILPAMFNEFITLLKETSVAGYIAVRELTKIADSIRGVSFFTEALYVAAAIYLTLVVCMTGVQHLIERRLSQSDKG